MGQERTITVSKPTTTETQVTTPSNQPATEVATAATHEDLVQDMKSSDEHLASNFAEQPGGAVSCAPPLHGEKG